MKYFVRSWRRSAYIPFSYRLTTVVCESVLVTPTPKDLGQEVHTKSFMKHFANGTSRTVSRPVAFQWPQNHRTYQNWTQQRSVSTPTVTKRSFPPTAANDAVSRNITIVLENLLKDYESSQLPTHGKGNNFLFISSSQMTQWAPILSDQYEDLEIYLFSFPYLSYRTSSSN
jgi:hypothetical protein